MKLVPAVMLIALPSIKLVNGFPVAVSRTAQTSDSGAGNSKMAEGRPAGLRPLPMTLFIGSQQT